MRPLAPEGGRPLAVLLVATPLVLATLAPAAAAGSLLGGDGGLVSLDGDDAIVSLGDDGLLGDDAGLLSASASASASPDTVPPGELVVVTFRLESAELLEISLDETVTCTVTLPDGRTAEICEPETSPLDVDLLGSGDQTHRLGLIAPDAPGTYQVTVETSADLNVGGGAPSATTAFTVEDDNDEDALAGTGSGSDGAPAGGSGQGAAAASTDDGSSASAAEDAVQAGSWLVEHPWVLVAIAAAVSATAFTVAARAAPGR